MPHYGILRDHKFEDKDIDDVRGSDVYGVNDEKLGTIDDVIFDHATGDIRYVVLKTGGILSRKRVMVPGNRVEPYGQHEDKFYAELDKERLEMLPEFNDETLKTEGDWAKFEKNYEKRWNDGAVMYNKDTGRIITPPHEEAALSPPAAGSNTSAPVRKVDLKPEKMGKEDDYLGVASGTGKTTLQPKKPSIGGKEDVELMQRDARKASQREGMSPFGTEIPPEGPAVSGPETMREPGVYKLDPVVETEQGAGPAERQNVNRQGTNRESINQGRRWNDFQQNLRSRRDKIVVECPQCASQDKAA
ncbi:MAG TPA: PRC-barrel domain-containing protein [Candidatus Angelobacter sp.]|jgi:sporulation protein YlmC with PRC-barrel domain